MFVSLVSVVSSAEIAVKPGRFDHFDLSAPMRIVAGQDAEIRLQAKDAFNNVIPAFGESGKEFTVSVTGSAAVTPGSFAASSFKDGLFSLKLSDRAAQTVTLTIMEKGSSIPVVLKELTIVPTALSSFEIMGPRTAVAGERFLIHISPKDSFGNTVTEPMSARDLSFAFKAVPGQKVEAASVSDFAQGFAVATLFSEKVGAVTIEVKDQRTGKTGSSGEIQIVNGSAQSFRITAPDEIMQGESFGVTLEAVDRFGNPVTDYANSGKRVELSSSSKSRPIHHIVPAQSFSDGRATAVLSYEGSDREITLLAAEAGKEKSKGKAMAVIAPVPARIDVTTPSTAVAGEKFKIQVTVYNQKGNVFKNFSSLGRDVTLRTNGRGDLIPNRIRASEFVGGIAVEEVLYNRSESFTITAETPGMKLPEPPAPKPEKKVEKPAPQPVVKKEEPRKEEPKTGLPVWEGAKKELPKEEKKAPIEKKKAEVKKPTPVAPVAPPSAPAAAAPTPSVVPVPEPTVTLAPTPAPPVKEAKAPAAAQKPVVEKKEKPAEVAALKAEKPKTEKMPEKAPAEKAKEEPKKLAKKGKALEVSSLSVIETVEKTLILIHVPNLSEGEGRTTVETVGDKIILKLSPAVSKLDRMAQFDSAYVKNVSVEEDRKGSTIIKVELSKPVQYQLKEGKTSIVLTLTH